jgi:hypothetical protein
LFYFRQTFESFKHRIIINRPESKLMSLIKTQKKVLPKELIKKVFLIV